MTPSGLFFASIGVKVGRRERRKEGSGESQNTKDGRGSVCNRLLPGDILCLIIFIEIEIDSTKEGKGDKQWSCYEDRVESESWLPPQRRHCYYT